MPRESDAAGDGQPPGRERIEPIYRRLPRGPHTLDPRQIEGHQRARIQGAMIEAVARHGYHGVTVRQVISLAAVSRRSFYEQFANRHDCFLKTARTIAAAGAAAARAAADGAPDDPAAALTAALETLAADALERPAASRLLLAETLAAGETGALVLGEALASWEALLGALLVRGGAGGASLPAPILRAFTGAVHSRLLEALDSGAAADPARLGAELAAHGRALVPAGTGAAQKLASRLHDRERRAALAAASAASRPAPAGARERLLLSALRVGATQPTDRVGIIQIADGAGVTIGEFETHFAGAGECLREALASSSRRLVAIASRACELTSDASQSTRLALAATLGELAASPVEARVLALTRHRAPSLAAGVDTKLGPELGEALLGGERASCAPSAAAGAFWHVVRTALLAARAPLLPALSDHLAYVLLAPRIGASAAIEALGGAGVPLSGAASGARRSA